jgi:predicted S18 family serine protease
MMKKHKPQKVGQPAPFLGFIAAAVSAYGAYNSRKEAKKAEERAKIEAAQAEAQASATRYAQGIQAQSVRLQQEQARQREAIAARAAEALKVQPGLAQTDVQVGTSSEEATQGRKRRTQFFSQSNTGIRI